MLAIIQEIASHFNQVKRLKAKIAELEQELCDEQCAHEEIASMCFKVGGVAGDGTSVSAVKSIIDRLKELEGK